MGIPIVLIGRAKGNSLRAKSASKESDRNNALKESVKYLPLMKSYIEILDEEK